jgi:hypothetical protein
MKNYEATIARYNKIKEDLSDWFKEYNRLTKNGRVYVYRPDFFATYNSLIRQLHNAQINLNQIEVRRLNK